MRKANFLLSPKMSVHISERNCFENYNPEKDPLKEIDFKSQLTHTLNYLLRRSAKGPAEAPVKTWNKTNRTSADLFEKFYKRLTRMKAPQRIGDKNINFKGPNSGAKFYGLDLEYCEWLDRAKLKYFDYQSSPRKDEKEMQNERFYFGTIDSKSGKMHGVVREIDRHGIITESGYQIGVKHGLSVQYFRDHVKLSLFMEGHELSYYEFDPFKNFEEMNQNVLI
jgi:hypothetical protein